MDPNQPHHVLWVTIGGALLLVMVAVLTTAHPGGAALAGLILLGCVGAYALVAPFLGLPLPKTRARPIWQSASSPGSSGVAAGDSPVLGPHVPKPNPALEYLDLDLSALLTGWATMTTAQEDQFAAANLSGKLVRMAGQVADVLKDPPRVTFGIDQPAKGTLGLHKSHLNVSLEFESRHAASIMLLKPGDTIRVQGKLARLDRNLFRVPWLLFDQCELLEKEASPDGDPTR